MTDSTKFEVRKLIDLSGFDSSDGAYYIKKTEPTYKIKIPVGLKSGHSIPFLSWTKSSTSNDQYQFSISRFYKKRRDDGRTHVVLYCNYRKNGDTKRFECYSSVSDGSFWRFCVKDNRAERYDKGYNYVTTTFINIYLQKFIDEYKDYFDIQIATDSTISCEKTSELNAFLIQRITSVDSCDTNKFFLLMDIFFPPVDYMKEYKRRIFLLLKYLSDKINQNTLEENVSIASDLFCSLNSNGVGRSIELSDITSRRHFYKIVKKAFEEFFLKYFTIDNSTKKHIYTKNFLIGFGNFYGIINSVEIKYKKNNKKFIMYYMQYFSDSLRTFRDLGPIKTIIYIEPILKSNGSPNEITMYGLDEIYVAGGAIINKIFDYQSQTPITVLAGHLEEYTQEYRYIGDLTNYSFLP